jgi:hypothetical protein
MRLYIPVIFLSLFSIIALPIWAQEGGNSTNLLKNNPRALWHDKIDQEQKKAMRKGGDPALVKVNPDADINLLVTDALIRKVDAFQIAVEEDSLLDHRLKVKYLRGMEDVLAGFNEGWNTKYLNPSQAPELIRAYFECMEADRKGQPIDLIIDRYNYQVGTIVSKASSFFENPGLSQARNILFLKYCRLYPENILPQLRNNVDYPFVDSLIIAEAYRNPRRLYDYAAAGNRLGGKIRTIHEPLVRTISQLATSRRGQIYFPFLDLLYRDEITLAAIDNAASNELSYFRLLVKTQIDYAGRLVAKDTPMEMQALTDMLTRKAKENYIREINALHDYSDAVRFKCLEPLTSEELYYLAVLGEDEIYTSSYTNGVYKLMFQKMTVASGDSLLLRLNFDHFRKFIKMAAGYNTLDHFLATMNKENAIALMRAFALRLENTRDMEEPVDVADSYGSIRNEEIKNIVLNEIINGKEENIKKENRKGEVIYDILYTLFASSEESNNIDLSARLGIPPVYSVGYNTLADDSGRVIQQVFFYGDQDGVDSYANFMSLFRNNPNWKVTTKKEWVEITSTKGRPVMIFANLPLDNETEKDAVAQHRLSDYLAKNNLKPTIVVHRGHSYHVKYTINQLAPTARIVILGSCGGYHNLDQVLDIAPDAHIISSKQVGTRVVNEPILNAINESVRNGKSVEWIPIWNNLANTVKDERFEDYIPPHKNLGALFIKAYKNKMGDQEN